MGLWVPHSIRLAGTSPVILSSLTSVGVPQGVDVSADPTAGSPYPRVIFTRSKRPMLTFTTRDIATVLALTGSTSLGVKSGGTYTGIELILALLDDCGRPSAGSVHRKIAYDLGCLIPRTLSGSAGQDAELTCEFMALSSDGSTSPMSIAGSQALPTLPTTEERYVIHNLALTGSISVDRLQQLSVDFGITATQQVLDSGVYPTHISIDSQVPRVTFSGLAPDKFDSSSIPDGGLSVAHASSEMFFRRRKAGEDVLYATTDEEHVKLTLAGLAQVDDVTSSNNAPAVLNGSVTGVYDGTNAPFVLSTGAAIEVA